MWVIKCRTALFAELLLPDCICRSASATAPRLHRSTSTAACRLHLLQLLVRDCIRFNCSPTATASAAAPDCVCFNCCSPIASASAAAPWLRPLQLMLPDWICFNCSPIVSTSTAAPWLRPLRLLLPDCFRFDCCSPIASASTAAPRLHPPAALEDSSPSPMFKKILCVVRGSVKYEGRVSLV